GSSHAMGLSARFQGSLYSARWSSGSGIYLSMGVGSGWKARRKVSGRTRVDLIIIKTAPTPTGATGAGGGRRAALPFTDRPRADPCPLPCPEPLPCPCPFPRPDPLPLPSPLLVVLG